MPILTVTSFLQNVLPKLISIPVVDMNKLCNLSAVGIGAIISNSASGLAVLALLETHFVEGAAGAAVVEGLVALPVEEVVADLEGWLGFLAFGGRLRFLGDEGFLGILRRIRIRHIHVDDGLCFDDAFHLWGVSC